LQQSVGVHVSILKKLDKYLCTFCRWCGPCKLLGPRLEKEVDKHNGKVLLAKVDVDDMGLIAMKYKVLVFCKKFIFDMKCAMFW